MKEEKEADVSSEEKKPKIYIASKTYYAQQWIDLRDILGYNIISTWINEASKDASINLNDLANRCIEESKSCDVMIVYAKAKDYLKGAFIEMGVALSVGKPIILVNTVLKEGSVFTHLPNVRQAESLNDALDMALSTPQPYKGEAGKDIEEVNWKAKYEKCINVIKRFDAGIIGMYDL